MAFGSSPYHSGNNGQKGQKLKLTSMNRVARAAVVGLAGTLLVGGLLPAGAGAATTTTPPPVTFQTVGAAPKVPARATDAGTASASTPLQLSVLLQPRNEQQMRSLAQAIATPASPEFRQFLAPGQFAQMFGPTQATIDAVVKGLQARGLHPGTPTANGLDIPVNTTVAAAQSAFSVRIRNYHLPSGRVAYANVNAPTLPEDATDAVIGVYGLDNLNPPMTNYQAGLDAHQAASLPARAPSGLMAAGPTACSAAQGTGSQTANQLATAYGFNGLYNEGDLGSGATVALFELGGYSTSDIATYQSCYGTSATVTPVAVNGADPTSINTAVGEVTGDIEITLGLAPQATILVYVGGGYMNVFNQIVSDDTAPVVSSSYFSACELNANSSTVSAENTDLVQAMMQGQTFFGATGDGGSEDCLQNNAMGNSGLSVQDPGSQPFITGVGGTNISSDGPPPSESGWNGSTGGISKFWPMPTYQSSTGVPGVINSFSSGTPCANASGNCREVPDVSALSGSPGYAFYCTAGSAMKECQNAGWVSFFGTSGAAPLWAAFAALTVASCNVSHRLGFINPVLYQLAALPQGAGSGYFNDVTTGNNDLAGNHSGTYPATSGYDMVTGLGSPIGLPLAGALCNDPVVTVTVTGSGVYGGPISFNDTPGTLPAGVTGVSGSLINCSSTVAPGTVPGTYNGTISGCQGLSLTGPNAAKYQISYIDGGVTVSKANTVTTVNSSVNPSVFGQSVTFTATVTANLPGAGTPSGTVTFFDGATQLASKTLSAASASFTIAALSVATHSITVQYSGDGNFLSSTSGALSQVVNKAPTNTTLTANPAGSVAFGHPVTFSATVSVPPPGAGSPTGPVVFSVDGTTVQTVNLNASEQATVTTSALTPGTHLIGAAYQGDGNFLGSSATLIYSVTCTVTITGNHPGSVIASGDSTCIVNATVGGAVVVPAGTSLAVVNSTVHGSINAPSQAGHIEVCGSTLVGGSVTVGNAAGLVIVGDPGDANCAVNTIGGTLSLENNTHGVEAIGNTVANLVVFGNSGPGPYPGDVTTISGNIIAP